MDDGKKFIVAAKFLKGYENREVTKHKIFDKNTKLAEINEWVKSIDKEKDKLSLSVIVIIEES